MKLLGVFLSAAFLLSIFPELRIQGQQQEHLALPFSVKILGVDADVEKVDMTLVDCRSEFVSAQAAAEVRVFPLDRASVGGVRVDVAAEFAS
jgi:hypothetical protein